MVLNVNNNVTVSGEDWWDTGVQVDTSIHMNTPTSKKVTKHNFLNKVFEKIGRFWKKK
jgi:hypothetical protein